MVVAALGCGQERAPVGGEPAMLSEDAVPVIDPQERTVEQAQATVDRSVTRNSMDHDDERATKGNAPQPNRPAEVNRAPAATGAPPIPPSKTGKGDSNLVTLDVKISNVPMTIQVPKGATIDEDWITGTRIVGGDHFGLTIDIGYGNPSVEKLRKWRPDHADEWNILVHNEDAILIQEVINSRIFYNFAAKRTVGMVDYCFEAARPDNLKYTKDDYLLILRCARTLKRKDPLPDDPAPLFKELGAKLEMDDDGKVIGVHTPEFDVCSVTDSTLDMLKKLPHLKQLSLDGGDFTDRGAAHLADLASLEHVVFDETCVTDDGLKHLARCRKLKSITVRRILISGIKTKITGVGFVYLQDLEHLTSLDMLDSDVTDEGLAVIARLPNLTELTIGGYRMARSASKITDDGLAHLKGHSKLRSLHVSRTHVTDIGLAHLAELTKLERLYIADNNISDAGLAKLKGLTKLKELDLAKTKITDAGLDHLKGLSNLRELYLEDAKVTDEGVQRLRQALRHCEIEH